MPNYVHVSPEFKVWLDKAIDFAKRNEQVLVGTVIQQIIAYLKENNVPHHTKDSKDSIPAGHYYHEG